MKRGMAVKILILSTTVVYGCLGLLCYNCENEPNNFLCIGEYNLKTCESGFDTCQTTVSYSDVNEQLSIIKTCTKNSSCQLQIKEHAFSIPCDKTGSDWICTTCCSEDGCNLNNGRAVSPNAHLLLTLPLLYLGMPF